MKDPITKKWMVLTDGRWGRGDTVAEAAKHCREAGGMLSDKTYVELILNDETPVVTSDGWIERSWGSTAIRFGYGLSLGQLLRVMHDPKKKGAK